MIATIVTTIIIFLLLALGISLVEQKSGYMGDSSLVPGCLGIMVGILFVVIAFGLCTGLIQISIQ